jgi:zinc transporter ZupT
MAALPGDFFTPESMLTLAGATLITTVITNTCQHVFNWNPKWFGLLIALLIAVVGVLMTDSPKLINFFMGIINGFLIYASSTGIMQMAGTGPDRTKGSGKPGRRFWDKWY